MRPRVTLRRALEDPNLLGHALPGDSWKPWRTLLIAAMGEALTDDEREVFRKLTGRPHEPLQPVREAAFGVGRRGGKSRAMSTLACYLAGLCEHAGLVPGEGGVCLAVALDQKVATIILNYAQAAFEGSPVLRSLVAGPTVDTLELTNGITLEVRPASFRRLRGPTYVAVLADEAAYWYVGDEFANPDVEILAAVRPGLLTTGGPLIMASSPYARRGVLWNQYHANYGPEGDPLVLVAQASTIAMNPNISQAEVDRALAADRVRNVCEYLAQFRDDVSGFVGLEVVEACVADHRELPPAPGVKYYGFVDPSGGSKDAMTLAISHKTGDGLIFIDCVREAKPPFSPAEVAESFAKCVKGYGCTSVQGDRYGGEWPRESFRNHGVAYEPHAAPKTDLYRDLLPLLNGGGIVLPTHERLVGQICGLERRTAKGTGREIIDHAPRAHDDVANAVAGAAPRPAAHPRKKISLRHRRFFIPFECYSASIVGKYCRTLKGFRGRDPPMSAFAALFACDGQLRGQG